jgi:AcrR family transcriptional regulator
MPKTPDRRAETLNLLADHVLQHGLAASSLRSLAKAAQTSDRMLLYYFKDKSEIIAATIEVIAERMVLRMNGMISPQPLPFDALLRHLALALAQDEFKPFMRLWLEIASLSARDDPFYRQIGEAIGRGFLVWGARQLEPSNDQSSEKDAARLLLMTEGMVFLNSIGLNDVIERAIGTD